jgi:uncharacterized repeat protein (TIGR01451 family)
VFAAPVTGFETGDVTVGGTASPTTGTVTQIEPNDGTTYKVAVTGMTSAGTVTASLAAGKATDSAGNTSLAATSADSSVEFAPPPPTVSSINRKGATPTNAAGVQFAVTFSEDVTGVDAGDFSAAQTGVTGASVTEVSGTGSDYTVTVGTGTGDGTLGLNLTDDDSIKNGLKVSLAGTGSGSFTGQTYEIDKTGPEASLSQASGQADPAASGPINFTVVFAAAVTGFETGDVTVGGTASPTTGTVTEIEPNNGTTYKVAVTGMTSAGTVTASLDAGKATDSAGNTSLAATSADNSVEFAPPAPSVSSITRSGTTPTNADTLDFAVTFSESVTGIDTGDFALAKTGTADGAIASVSAASGESVTVTVNSVTGDGTLGLNLKDNDSIQNALKVVLKGAGTEGENDGSFTGETYTVDNTEPTASVAQASGQTDPTNSMPVRFAVTFSEIVTGFDETDIDFSGSTAPGDLAAALSGTGSAYTAEISGMTGAGNVIVKIAAGAGKDSAGNGNSASAGGDNTVAYDPAYVPNNPPTDISLSGTTVAENQPAGTVVGTLSATDPDGGPHTFTVSSEGSLFAVEGSTLKTAAPLDFEGKSVHTVHIGATDGFGASYSKSFEIGVSNVNEAPGSFVLSRTWLDEKQPVGTSVGEFTALGDPDAGETFTFALVSGEGSDDNSSFAVEGNVLKTAAVLDYDVKSTCRIRAKASDKGGLGVEAAFVITLNNLNEAPTDIALSSTGISENMPPASVVGTFSGTDPNPGDTLTFSLLPGDGDTYFYVNAGTVLKIRESLDYEKKQSYSVGVRASDGKGGTFDKNFTVTVNNVNEAPALSPPANQKLLGASSAAAAFTVSDPEKSADSLTVSGKSSDTALLPQTGITFGGSGANRTVTLRPVSGKSGTAKVTLTVSDGELSSEGSFTLTVTIQAAPYFDKVSVKPLEPDKPVAPGDTVVFRAVIPNTGNDDASGAVLTVPIPTNTAYVTGSSSVRFTDILTGQVRTVSGVSLPQFDATGNRLIWTGDIPAGLQAEILFSVTADDDLKTGDVISAEGWTFGYDSDGDGVNDVNVKPQDSGTGDSGNTVTVLNSPLFGKSSVTLSDPDKPVGPGDRVSFTGRFPNTGNVDAEGVVLTVPIPTNTVYVPGSASVRFTDIETGAAVSMPGASQPQFDEAGNRLVWTGDVPAGVQAEILFDVTADEDLKTGDVISAEGWTVGYDSDGDGVNDKTVRPQDTETGGSGGTVTVLNSPVFGNVYVGPSEPDKSVAPGGRLGFTARLPNTGNTDAEGVVLTVPVPTNTVYVPGSATVRFTDIETGAVVDMPGASLPQFDEAGNRLVWTGDVPAGVQAEIVFDVTADEDLETGDVISAEGWTLGYDTDGDGTNDSTVKAGDSGTSGAGSGVIVVEPDPTCLKGDVYRDGEITLRDALTVLKIMISGTTDKPALCADVNGDGRIGFPELLFIQRKLAE